MTNEWKSMRTIKSKMQRQSFEQYTSPATPNTHESISRICKSTWTLSCSNGTASDNPFHLADTHFPSTAILPASRHPSLRPAGMEPAILTLNYRGCSPTLKAATGPHRFSDPVPQDPWSPCKSPEILKQSWISMKINKHLWQKWKIREINKTYEKQ